MGYCKHQWQDRTEVLREVFRHDAERRTHEFHVCMRCLRIDEVRPEIQPNADRRERAA